ncbi:hypothetical protein LB507_008615 [Fusarium sp. FIESC RH6]|nr:hypothetical protein LB507_008615 [Fusarium sp. FIESC RH6]
MATQVPQPVDNGHRETGQEIHNIAATNGSICLAGTFQDVTIGNNHPGETAILSYDGLPLTSFLVGTIEEKIDSCRNALFVSHPDLDIEALVSAKGKRTEGTCRWILPDPHYQAWLAKEFPVLRVSGGPGKGKTMLALFLTEQLKTLCRQTGDRLLLFFCRFQDNRYNDPRNVLRSLIYQLLEFSHECPQITEILKYFESPEKAKDVMSNFEGLWKIFETLLSQPDFRTIWCIIDGIDECHSPETLAEKFYEHCRQRTVRTKVQLLMLGRDIGGSDAHHVIKLDVDQKKPTRGGAQNLEPLDLVSVLGRDTNSFYAPNLIELDMNHRQRVKSDVECFIISGLEPLEKVPRFAQIREEVTSMLVEKAEGTFLWVSFVIAELRGKKTCLQIRDTVESFPKGLNATFARMLCRIEPEYRQASASILKWVAFAERPLNLNELAAATAKAATGKYSEADLEATADIIQLLGPFLQVQRRIVFFVHQSAKEYLMKIHQDSDSPLGQSFNFAKCHGTIAHRCLETLKEKYPQNTQDSSDTDNFDEADHIYKTDKECPSRRCLTAYAKKHWSYHTRLSAISPDDINRPFFENMVLQRKAIISLHQASFLGVREHWPG